MIFPIFHSSLRWDIRLPRLIPSHPPSHPVLHSSPPLTPFSKTQQHNLIPTRASAALLSCFPLPPPHYSLTCSLCRARALLVAVPIPTSMWVCKPHMHTPLATWIKSTQPPSQILLQTVLTPSSRNEKSQFQVVQHMSKDEFVTTRDSYFITEEDCFIIY